MREYLLLGYCISHIFMMVFIFNFTRRRLSISKTCMILTAAATMLIGLEVHRYFLNEDSPIKVGGFLLQVAIVQGTAILISRYRDARALFTGLTATNYAMAGSAIGGIVHMWTGNLLLSLFVCILIHAAVLAGAIVFIRVGYLALQANPSKMWWQICILPVLFYMSIFTCASWPVILYNNPGNIVSTLLFLTSMFAAYAVLIRLFHIRQHEAKIIRSNEVLLSYSKVLEQEQKHVEEVKKEIAIERHDYEHHLRILLALSEEDNLEGVRTALSDMLSRSEETKLQQTYCKSVPVNGVLTYFVKEAEKNGIQTRLNINISEELPVSQIELASAMSNLLDNAIRACSQLPEGQERWLSILAKYAGKQVMIEVSNPCDPTKVIFDEETGLPLSERGEEHGIGTQSVLAFARRNDAEFDCEVRQSVFYARLLI
ncbi:MAG: GHKL domain-containing protein [bacterium]|nr:GHKL domain-containing protein [bacterium]